MGAPDPGGVADEVVQGVWPFRALLAVVLAVAFSGVTPGTAVAAPDGYEPDGTPAQATVIPTDGTIQDRSIDPGNDLDFVKFTALAGHTYEVQTGPHSTQMDTNYDTRLILYAEDGTTQLDNNDDAGPQNYSRVMYTPSVDTTLYARASYWSGSSVGLYGLRVRDLNGVGGTTHITGTVTDGTSPISGITVSTWYQGDPWFASLAPDYWFPGAAGTTAMDGTYSLDVSPGSHRVYFEPVEEFAYAPEYYDDTSDPSLATLIVVGSGETSSGIDATLTPLPRPTPGTLVPTTRVSSHVSIATTRGSQDPALSADGRYVAFVSGNEWDALDITNGAGRAVDAEQDIYVKDRDTGSLTLASVAWDGSEPNDWSYYPDISGDGRRVAFYSTASNLVPDDTNGTSDTFVRDLDSGETTCVNVTPGGAVGNGDSGWVKLSADGRYAAFWSNADDLVPNDTNGTTDVFVRDLVSGETTRASVDADGIEGAGASGSGDLRVDISSDGRYVAFITGNDWDPGDTNGWDDAYVKNMLTGAVTCVSVDSAGLDGDANASEVVISDDGSRIAFVSAAANMVANDTNSRDDVFVHDLGTSETRRVSVAADATEADGDSYYIAMSGDGRYVGFVANVTTLMDGDVNGQEDVFIYDNVVGRLGMASLTPGSRCGNDDSEQPSFSYDGGFIGFDSWADSLVVGDINQRRDVFVSAVDTAPPTTTSNAVAGYVMTATITLTATDTGSGVAETYHRLNGGAVATGTVVTTSTLGAHTLSFWSVDNVGNVETSHTVSFTVYAAAAGYPSLQGPDRYGTAIEISKAGWPTGAHTIVVATGENWPDALGGSALAGAVGGPVLLVMHDSVPASVSAEITRLGVTKAYVLGETDAISAPVITALRSKVGTANVTRIGGADRFRTAEKVASETVRVIGAGYDGNCFVATGGQFCDALSASPIACAKRWPVYLSGPTSVASKTADAMKAVGVKSCVLLGGEAAITPDTAVTLLNLGFTASRLDGADRYETAGKVAAYGVSNAGLMWDGIGIATGEDFPDALAGGPGQGKAGSVMLLTRQSTLPTATSSKLTANKATIHTVRFFGGLQAISQAVRTAVNTALQ